MPQYSHTSSGEENVKEAERKVERRYDREKEEKEVERKEISGGGGNVRRGRGGGQMYVATGFQRDVNLSW